MANIPSSTGDRTASSARPIGESARDAVRDRAHEAFEDAKRATRDGLDQQRSSTAAGMSDVAAALRDTAEKRRRDGDDGFARVTASAADGFDRLSGALRNKDASTMLRDVDAFARRQPAAFFGLAVVAGFVAVRLLKPDHH